MSKATTQEEVDKRMEVWHTMPKKDAEALGYPPLHDYLGWTFQEYIRYIESRDIPDE